jgi:hypothetical protein
LSGNVQNCTNANDVNTFIICIEVTKFIHRLKIGGGSWAGC